MIWFASLNNCPSCILYWSIDITGVIFNPFLSSSFLCIRQGYSSSKKRIINPVSSAIVVHFKMILNRSEKKNSKDGRDSDENLSVVFYHAWHNLLPPPFFLFQTNQKLTDSETILPLLYRHNIYSKKAYVLEKSETKRFSQEIWECLIEA